MSMGECWLSDVIEGTLQCLAWYPGRQCSRDARQKAFASSDAPGIVSQGFAGALACGMLQSVSAGSFHHVLNPLSRNGSPPNCWNN